jgi:hypothetical protein
VSDPGGPFDKEFYVTDPKLRIRLAELVNSELQVNSNLWKVNHSKGYNDIDTIRAQAAAHERLHTALIAEALPKLDPASDIERMINPDDREALQKAVDGRIKEADRALYAATMDHDEIAARLRRIKDFDRPGKILLYDAVENKYSVYTIPNIASIRESGN